MVILLVTAIVIRARTYMHNLLLSVIDRWSCHGITTMSLGLSNKLLVVCPVQLLVLSSQLEWFRAREKDLVKVFANVSRGRLSCAFIFPCETWSPKLMRRAC